MLAFGTGALLLCKISERRYLQQQPFSRRDCRRMTYSRARAAAKDSSPTRSQTSSATSGAESALSRANPMPAIILQRRLSGATSNTTSPFAVLGKRREQLRMSSQLSPKERAHLLQMHAVGTRQPAATRPATATAAATAGSLGAMRTVSGRARPMRSRGRSRRLSGGRRSRGRGRCRGLSGSGCHRADKVFRHCGRRKRRRGSGRLGAS